MDLSRIILLALIQVAVRCGHISLNDSCSFKNGQCSYSVQLAHQGTCSVSTDVQKKITDLEAAQTQHMINQVVTTKTMQEIQNLLVQMIHKNTLRDKQIQDLEHANKTILKECSADELNLVKAENEKLKQIIYNIKSDLTIANNAYERAVNESLSKVSLLNETQTRLAAIETENQEFLQKVAKLEQELLREIANRNQCVAKEVKCRTMLQSVFLTLNASQENEKLIKEENNKTKNDLEACLEMLSNVTEKVKVYENTTSCKGIKATCPGCVSGNYNITLNGTYHQVYCDMTMDNGGWTLVYSYTFTDYKNFGEKPNAVTPHPNWPQTITVNLSPESTTTPLSETDFNAMDFQLWKNIGSEFFIKSNINNWVVCIPLTGSLVDWKDGLLNCRVIYKLTNSCHNTVPTQIKILPVGPDVRADSYGYFFDSSIIDWAPTHDPCSNNTFHNIFSVVPYGNIYVR